MTNKIVFIDWSFFVHAAIKSKNAGFKAKLQNPNLFILPAPYTATSMLYSSLAKVGLNKDDIIIAAMDRKSWRKEFEKEYKANREELRSKDIFINWQNEYKSMNTLAERLAVSSQIYFIAINNMEADDIISYGVRHYSNKECIIISPDHDFDQLLYLDNVKIFSPHMHPSVKKCPYRILAETREQEKVKALKSIADKIREEKTDNLTSPITTQEEHDKRKMLVDMLNLPEFVTNTVKPILENITEPKDYDLNLFPYPKIGARMCQLYDGSKIISYEKCFKKWLKK